MLKKIIAIFFAMLSCACIAQTSPGLSYGQIPTAGQWNSYFAGKFDYLAPGNSGNVLTSNGSTWYSNAPAPARNLNGGAVNSIPYQTAPNTTAFLPQGSGVLYESAGAPAWSMSPTLTSITTTNLAATGTINLLGQTVSIFEFMSPSQRADVQAGTLLVDTSTAFVSAIASGKPFYVPNGSGWKYLIGSTVVVPTNTIFYGDGSKLVLANGVNNHVFRIANGADNVEIRGLDIDGNKNNNTGGNCISTGGTGGTNIRIKGNYTHDCSANGISFAGTTTYGIYATGNYSYNNVLGGITINDTVTKFQFSSNFTWLNGTHGIGFIGTATHGSVTDNVSWDNGQNCPTCADNYTGYGSPNDDILIANNVSQGGGNNGIHFSGTNFTYSGNTVYGAAQYGIFHGSSSPSLFSTNVVMIGNSSYSNHLDGILLYHVNSGSVTGNFSSGNNRGIATNASNNIAIGINTVKTNTLSGIANDAASTHLSYSGNISQGNGGDGINLAGVTNSTLSVNDSNNNTGYGINGGSGEGSNLVNTNTVLSNTAGQIAALDATSIVYGNNTGSNTTTTGSGRVVLENNPTVAGGSFSGLSTLNVKSVGTGTKNVGFASNGAMTADHNLNIDLNDSGRTLNLAGNLMLANSLTTIGNFSTTLTATGVTALTLPTSGTLATLSDISLSGTTGSIGGSLLAAGACSSGSISIAGATTSMAVSVTPSTYPGDGNYWNGYVSAPGSVTVNICAAVAGTPAASSYNVRVLK